MTTVVITQPMLFPWLGFFEQLSMADVFIYLDDVQFSKGSFTNRVQIDQGTTTKWLTIPISSHQSSRIISKLQPASAEFKRRHLDFTRQVFRNAPFREAALEILQSSYRNDDFIEILISSIECSASYLGLTGRKVVLRSSDMAIRGSSWQRVLDLVKAVGGTRYLTGHGAVAYLNHEAFEQAGVDVEYMSYSKTTWPRGSAMPNPYISILDAIAWMGERASGALHPRSLSWRKFVEESKRQ